MSGIVWKALGDVDSFIDPFMGSAALLLGRPAAHLKTPRREIVNDLDGLLVNFWRAVKADPEAVARYADNPKFESDLHARHYWLVQHRSALSERLEGDPDYYDVKAAGWWVWGLSNWTASDWCTGRGPWRTIGGRLVRAGDGDGIVRKLIHVGNGRVGVESDKITSGGVIRRIPHLGNGVVGVESAGIKRQRIDLGIGNSPHKGVERVSDLHAYMDALAARLEHVTVVCGDWTRVIQPSVCYSLRDTERTHITGVVLDPPYDQSERKGNIYNHESPVSADVRAWALANGDNPLMRIVLFGYDGEHEMPDTWRAHRWKANGGYANPANGRGRANAERETIWFSPHCLKPDAARQLSLFDDAAD